MRWTVLLGLLAGCLTNAAPAAPPDTTIDAGLWASVDAFLEQERDRQRIPGMSAAIAWGDHAIRSRGYGRADVENDVLATAATVYRAASISRMMTAVAVLQLVQADRLNLKSPMRNYAPEFPDKGAVITIEHLLAHLSGIRPCKSRKELFNREFFPRLVDTVALFKDDPLIAPPGRRFVNTPFGYNLLGLVVERVSGMTFESYMRTHVFTPAGMTASAIEDPTVVVPHRARGYALDKDGTLRNSAFVDLSVRLPADGVISTAGDLARFGRRLLRGKLLDPPLVKVMSTEYRTSDGEPTRYGLGCFVREEGGRRIIGHAGAQPQVSTMLLIVPEQALVIVILVNLERANVRAISLGVVNLLLAE